MQQVRQMIQTLLAERFKLTLHRDTRQLPTYALVVAKNGPKIRSGEDGQPQTSAKPGRLEATKITTEKLAEMLARITGQQVADATDLKGVYDFTLAWSPLDGPKMTDFEGSAAGGADGPSIVSALQDQLGLKLEGRKKPVEILVVDHVDKRPTRK